jgi:hypothetical protein
MSLAKARAATFMRALECPPIFSTDLDGLRLLATFGETGWFGGLAPCSGPEEGRKNRVTPEGTFLYFPHGGAHAPHFTNVAKSLFLFERVVGKKSRPFQVSFFPSIFRTMFAFSGQVLTRW